MAGKLRLEGNGGYYAGLESQESLIADVIWKLYNSLRELLGPKGPSFQ
jgi:hypothetical protein